MKVKSYVILQRAIEEGYKRGYSRAHKYVEVPQPEALEEEILNTIMGEICDVFSFDDESCG